MNENKSKKNNDSIASSILEKIEKGDVHMKSRAHFVLKGTVYAGTTIGVLILGLYIASLISFTLRANGYGHLPEFGAEGYRTLLTSLPWLLVIAVLAVIVALELLGKKYTFIYRRPAVYSVLFVAVVLIAGGIIIEKTQVHDALYEAAEENKLPFANRIYKRYGAVPFKMVHYGIITDAVEEGYIIDSPQEGMLTIVITEHTQYPRHIQFDIDDKLMVMGQIKDSRIEAVGIKKLIDEGVLRFKHHMQRPPAYQLSQ